MVLGHTSADRTSFHLAASCEYELKEGGVFHTMYSGRYDGTVG